MKVHPRASDDENDDENGRGDDANDREWFFNSPLSDPVRTPFSESDNVIKKVSLGEEHPATAVPVIAQIIQDDLGVLAAGNAILVFRILVRYQFPAGKTSDWYEQG